MSDGRKQPPAPSAWDAFREAVTQGWTGNVLDPVSAAIQAALPSAGGKPGSSMWDKGSGFRQAFQRDLAIQQERTRQMQQQHPVASTTGNVAGALTSPINRLAAPAKGAGLVKTALRAAVPAGVYSAVSGAATAPAGSSAGDVGTRAFKQGAEGLVTAPLVAGGIHGAGTLGSKILRRAAPLAADAAGNLSDDFTKAVREAFPNGEVRPEDIDPATAQALVNRTGRINAQTVRQAVAAQHGATPIASTTAGTLPPKLVAGSPAFDLNAQQGKAAVAQSVNNQFGGQAPDPVSLAGAVAKGYAGAKQAVDNLYADLAKNDTVLGPSFAEGLPGEISAQLKNNKFLPGVNDLGDALTHRDTPEFSKLMLGSRRGGQRIPSLLDEFGALSSEGTPEYTRSNGTWFDAQGRPLPDNLSERLETQAQASMLTRQGGEMPEGVSYSANPASLEHVDRLRQSVNAAIDRANSTADRSALMSLRDAVDNHLERTLKSGDYTGEGGDQALEQLAAARKANGFLKENYEDPTKAHPAIYNTVQALKMAPDEGGNLVPQANMGDIERAGQKLGDTLVNPKTLEVTPQGKSLWQSVSKLNLDPEAQGAVHDYIRSTVGKTATDAAGTPVDLASDPRAIQTFLRAHAEPGGTYEQAFAPGDVSTLRTAAATHNMLSGSTPSGEALAPQADGSVGALRAKQIAANTALAAAIAASHRAGIPLNAAITPFEAVGGLGVSKLINSRLAAGEAAKLTGQELAGAPAYRPDLSGAAPLGAGLTNAGVSAANPMPAALPQEAPPPPRAMSLEKALADLPDEAPASGVPAQIDPAGQFKGKAMSLDDALAGLPDDTDQRPQRASGGRVDDIEHLVGRLMRGAQKAKREIDSHTEGLLKHDDSTIVSALNTAKRAL